MAEYGVGDTNRKDRHTCCRYHVPNTRLRPVGEHRQAHLLQRRQGVYLILNMPLESFQSTGVYYWLYLGKVSLREASFIEMKAEVYRGQMLISLTSKGWRQKSDSSLYSEPNSSIVLWGISLSVYS